MSTNSIFLAYGLLGIGSLSSTAFFMIVVLFFKSTSSSGSFFGILSAASGFVIGAYMPVSQFSEGIRTMCNIFPATHITMLFRNILLSGVLNHIDEDINGLDKGEFVKSMKDFLSFKASMFGEVISHSRTIIYIMSFSVVSIIVMIVMYSKTYKRS